MTRAFVVGNGPSLNDTNLDLLVGEVTFAVNNIHLIYDRTSWRPKFFLRAEEAGLVPKGSWTDSIDIHLALGAEIYANKFFFHHTEANEHVHILKTCYHYTKHYDDPDIPHLWHLPTLCTFGSSVNVAVQLAHLQGYSPIYLVGCDLGYRDGKPSHFSPDYEHGAEQPARYANLDTLAAHMIASRSGAEIYNATIGGELEVYPRVKYDELF